MLPGLRREKALCLAFQQVSYHRQLLDSVACTVFLGVPHFSNDELAINCAISILKLGAKKKSKFKVSPDDRKQMADVSRQFGDAASTFPVLSVYELQSTKIKGSKLSFRSSESFVSNFLKIRYIHIQNRPNQINMCSKFPKVFARQRPMQKNF